jgi:uncharacterized membrane-anchored protein YitT (DUF2179 family)
MRKVFLPVLAAAVFWTCFMGIGVGFVGCGGCSTTANQAAYRATGTAVVTVDAAMMAWGAYVAKNHPGAETERKVADAYARYQQSVSVVADMAVAFQKAKASNDPSLPTAQANFNAVIAASAAALADLEGLIVGFGGKL